jgi:hypothetical protein
MSAAKDRLVRDSGRARSEERAMAKLTGVLKGPVANCVLFICAVGTGSHCCFKTEAGEGDTPLVLREQPQPGASTRVQIELKAQGLYRPGLPPGDQSGEVRMPKPLTVQIETRFVFHERLVQVGADGKAVAVGAAVQSAGVPRVGGPGARLAAVRQVVQAASAINGEIRPTSALIRPEVSLLVAQRRDTDVPVVVASPAGALTWYELELVQGLGDPLVLGDLLPEQAVKIGDRWRVRDSAAKALCGYDVVGTNRLEAVLESTSENQARIRVNGQVLGSALGGNGTMSCGGFLTFDRRSARIDRLEINRSEARQPGPIEAGLDIKSTLTVERIAAQPPASLSDAALGKISLEVTPERELLLLTAPGGRCELLHDRQWHMFWQDPKLTVLKRLVGGEVIAQCNISMGPTAGKGRHQDLEQFRDDVKRALKSRFIRFLGAGEVGADASGGLRYKVGVQGREGELGIIWYYYLLASPEGEQLVATYTLAEDRLKAFGDQDLEMMGSLSWLLGPRSGASR